MSLINVNIKFLRKKFGYTQETFAQKIGVNRPAVGAYEEARAEPKLGTLQTIADTFGLSVDALINKDLSKLSDKEFEGITPDVTGSKMRVLTITLNNEGNENIELVPHKASAGYTNGYADREYIEELPKLYLPMLGGGTHRGFEIKGDSMLPLKPGTIVVGDYVENWHDIKDGKTYVLVTENEGVVYKRVYNHIYENGTITLRSDNTIYQEYNIAVEEVLEVWEAKLYISNEFPEADGDMNMNQLAKTVMELQKEVLNLKKDQN